MDATSPSKDCLSSSDDSLDSKWDVPSTNYETAVESSKQEDGWTLVTRKGHKPKVTFQDTDVADNANRSEESKWKKNESKSNTWHTSGFNRSSLQRPSLAEGKVHQTLDLVKPTKNPSSINKSELPTIADASSQMRSNSSKSLPEGVFPLCEHFLQDNRKRQAFQHPKPCSKCKNNSMVLYGIWRTSNRKWQVMRPYPKVVNSHVPFQLCWHFTNGVECQKSPCTFAHGKEELMFWSLERQSGNFPALKT